MNKLVTFTFFLLGCLSCQEEVNNFNSIIVGQWYQESEYSGDPGNKYRSEFIFRKNKTYESSVTIVDAATHSTVGYLSLSTGNYEVEGNKLRFSNSRHYGLDDEDAYQDRNKLELLFSGGDDSAAHPTLSFSPDNNTLVLDYGECPDVLSMCIAEQTYHRVQ